MNQPQRTQRPHRKSGGSHRVRLDDVLRAACRDENKEDISPLRGGPSASQPDGGCCHGPAANCVAGKLRLAWLVVLSPIFFLIAAEKAQSPGAVSAAPPVEARAPSAGGLDDIGEITVRKKELGAPDVILRKLEVGKGLQETLRKNEVATGRQETISKNEIATGRDKVLKKNELETGRQECILKNETATNRQETNRNAEIQAGAEAVLKGSGRTINFKVDAGGNGTGER